MYELQKAFETELAKTWERSLRDLLALKLAKYDLKDPAALIDALVAHVSSGSGGDFFFETDDDDDRDIDISFVAEDYEFLESRSKRVVEKMPSLVTSLAESLAKTNIRHAMKELSQHKLQEDLAAASFRANLEERWGSALDELRLLLQIYADLGEEYWKKRRRSRSRRNVTRMDVLQRLHARSCQVFQEIVLLVENGFADGAMARWRTLHEICVTATVIADAPADAQLPERYLDYESVERKRRMEEYILCHEAMGEPPLSGRTIREVEQGLAAVTKAYGPSFEQPFGWAIPFVHPTRVSFRQLEVAADKAEMRAYYKMASFNVHASPGGLFHRLTSLDNHDLVIPGASNAGIDIPAVNTAFAVTQMAGLLISPPYKLDDLVRLKAFVILRDRAADKFRRAEKRLRLDDRRIRKSSSPRRQCKER